MNEYPTEEHLERIKTWPAQDFDGLMEYIGTLWEFKGWGFKKAPGGVYELHTGGWSGNEEIIQALHQNKLVWIMYWVESSRGGHYLFGRPNVIVSTAELIADDLRASREELHNLRCLAEGDEHATSRIFNPSDDSKRIEARIRLLQLENKVLKGEGDGKPVGIIRKAADIESDPVGGAGDAQDVQPAQDETEQQPINRTGKIHSAPYPSHVQDSSTTFKKKRWGRWGSKG